MSRPGPARIGGTSKLQVAVAVSIFGLLAAILLVRLEIVEAEAERDHPLFAGRQTLEHTHQLPAEQLAARFIHRDPGFFILNEIFEVGVFFLAMSLVSVVFLRRLEHRFGRLGK